MKWLFLIFFKYKPRLIPVIIIIALLFGSISFFNIPLEYLSTRESSFLTMMIDASSLSPDQIEKEICFVLEDSLRKIDGISGINSNISRGALKINIEVQNRENLDFVYNRCMSVGDEHYNSFPENVSRPVILKYSSDDMPVAVFRIESDIEKEALEDKWGILLGRLDGVGKVEILGAKEYRYELIIDKDLIKLHNIDIYELSALLRKNSEVSSFVWKDKNIILYSSFENIDDVLSLPVRNANNTAYYVKDFALLKKYEKEQKRYSSVNGIKSTIGYVFAEGDANIVKLSRDVSKVVEENDAFIIHTQGEYIEKSLNSLFKALILGLAISSLLIVVFFRRISMIFPVMLVIPVSVCITLIFMYFLNITINIMSMSAFLFALGLLYDNAIIIIDHLEKVIRQRSKIDLRFLFINTVRILKPLLLSTITTFAVFIPFFFIDNDISYIYKDFVYVLSFSLISSYIMASLIVPYFIVYIPMKKNHLKKYDSFEIFNGIFLSNIMKYRKVLYSFLCIVFIVSSFLFFKIGSQNVSNTPDNIFILFFQPGINSSKQTFFENMYKIEKYMSEFDEIDRVLCTYNQDNVKIIIRAHPEKLNNMIKKYNDIIKYMEKYPDIYMYLVNAPGDSYKNIDINIYHDEFEQRIKNAEFFARKIKDRFEDEIEQVVIKEKTPLEEIDIYPEVRLVNSFGINIDELSYILRAYIEGPYIKRFFRKDFDDLKFRLSEFRSIEEIKNIIIRKEDNISLKDIAQINIRRNPVSIKHIQGNAAVTVGITFKKGDVYSVINKIKKYLKSINNKNIIYDMGKTYSLLKKERKEMSLVILFTLILTSIILYMYYNSFYDVLLVFSVIPVTYSFIVIVMYMFSLPWSLPVYLAFILLSGILVNNSIYIIDQIKNDNSRSLFFRVNNGVNKKFRAVIITTFTTLCGIIPLLWADSFWKVMGVTGITGIIAGTFVSLYVLPVFYYSSFKNIK